MSNVDVLTELTRAGRVAALAAVTRAEEESPGSLLTAALGAYLSVEGAREVYVDPVGFERFISGGTNHELYRLTIEHLAGIHGANRPTAVLDIGCGDGRVTGAALGPSVRRVDLLEPSVAMLDVATATVSSPGREVVAHASGAAEFFASITPGLRWDTVQSTFAMHTLNPGQRSGVLREIAMHTDHFLMVDFDVPDFDDRSRDHARYAAQRYERGLAEYLDDDIVAQRFLMPVLVGQFDPSGQRHTFEQSAASWTADLTQAGFDSVRTSTLFDYWWAPAFCLEARRE